MTMSAPRYMFGGTMFLLTVGVIFERHRTFELLRAQSKDEALAIAEDRISNLENQLEKQLEKQRRDDQRQRRDVIPTTTPVKKKKTVLESWRTMTECTAYDLLCPLHHTFSAYPLREVRDAVPLGTWAPFTKRQTKRSRPGTRLAHLMRGADRRSPGSFWWQEVTTSDAAALAEADRRDLDGRFFPNLEASLKDATRGLKFTAWTMSNAVYAEEMLDDVVAMSREVMKIHDIVIVTLDRLTARACVAKGLRCAMRSMEKNETALRAQVQHTKFLVSKWLVDHDVSFLFFEMDVWFVKPASALPVARDFLLKKEGSVDLAVAGHQNNPAATNIGVYAVRANDRTRVFFQNCVDEAEAQPEKHDQLVFHNMLSWHRMACAQKKPPGVDKWKDQPGVPIPETPITSLHIPPHIGVCSITPVPTDETVFIHTLGTSPLQEHHGKRIHAKELGIWHGSRQYFSGGRRKFLAYDGHPLNAISICEKDGYHVGNYVKVRLAFLIGLARATNRILILPKVIADYYLFFVWPFLDLQSIEGLCEWRETNFPSNKKAWFNATHPFRTVAQISFRSPLVGVHVDGQSTWLRDDVAEPDSQSQWDLWAAVLDALEDRDLLLVNDAFLDGEFVRVVANCKDEAQCLEEHSKAASLFNSVYRRLKWCGTTINLKKHVAVSFQGFDCFGRGQSFDEFHEERAREQQRNKKNSKKEQKRLLLRERRSRFLYNHHRRTKDSL